MFNWIIPNSWNEVPTEDLEFIARLTMERELIAMQDERLGEVYYKLLILLRLSGLEGMEKSWTGLKPQYTFHTPSFWPWRREKVTVDAQRLMYLVREHLRWVDEPYNRLRSPYPTLKIKRRNFCGPSDRMTSLTYMQYQTAQNILTAYWQHQDTLRFLMEREESSQEAVMNQVRVLDELKGQFLATLFCPATPTREYKGEKKVRTMLPNDFDPRQVNQFAPLFRGKDGDRIFPVMLQFFLSVQKYYSTLYPDLFVKRKDDGEKNTKRPDFLMLEVETMAAVMKYQGFRDYQTIYDSEAVHILKVLDNMAKEAKELKRIHSKK